MAYLSYPNAHWEHGAVAYGNVAYLKIQIQEPLPADAMQKISTSIASLTNEFNLRLANNWFKNEKGQMCFLIIFPSHPSKISAVVKLLAEKLLETYPMITIPNTAIIHSSPFLLPVNDAILNLAQQVTALEAPPPEIITCRSSIFYQPMQKRLCDSIPKSPRQEEAIKLIQKEEMTKLRSQIAATAIPSSEDLKVFRDKVKAKRLTVKNPIRPSLPLSKQFQKGKKAFDADDYGLAIELYEDLVKKEMIPALEKAEAYYELFCLYAEDTDFANKLAALSECYSIMAANTLSNPYYKYWREKIFAEMVELITDYFVSYPNHVNKDELLGSFQCYRAFQELAKHELPFSSTLISFSLLILTRLVQQLETYCEQVRSKLEACLTGETENNDTMTELLKSEFEYDISGDDYYEAPPTRENYESNKTTIEQDLKINPRSQPLAKLFSTKRQYDDWRAKSRQPSAEALAYGRLLFPEEKKRFPAFNKRLLLPQPKESLPNIPAVNIHQSVTLRIAHEVFSMQQLGGYIQHIFTEEKRIKDSILQQLVTPKHQHDPKDFPKQEAKRIKREPEERSSAPWM